MTPRRRATDTGCGGPLGHFCMVVAALVIAALVWAQCARAEAAAPAAADIAIPQASYLYRFKLEREVAARFGSTDAVARIAGQVHQESRWKALARSPYAEGMAQFTPDTARWLVTVCPEIGAPDPWDPNWSVRAVVCYDAWLRERLDGAGECDRWAFTLSAYNGGLAWVSRDRDRASSKGLDSARWFGHVESTSARASWARTENRTYVERILRLLEPRYIAAGWPGQAVCP